jgi:hypothetical protein
MEGKTKANTAHLHQPYAQLLNYSASPENPPPLIDSAIKTFKLHTHFTNPVQQVHIFSLSHPPEPRSRASAAPNPP